MCYQQSILMKYHILFFVFFLKKQQNLTLLGGALWVKVCLLMHVRTYSCRAVEIPCPTCPTWSHFIQDKLKISIYLSF